MNAQIIVQLFLLGIIVSAIQDYEVIQNVADIEQVTLFTQLNISQGSTIIRLDGNGKSVMFPIAVPKTGYGYNLTAFIETKAVPLELGQITMSFGNPAFDVVFDVKTYDKDVSVKQVIGGQSDRHGSIYEGAFKFWYYSDGFLTILNGDKKNITVSSLVNAPSFNSTYAITFITVTWTGVIKPMFITFPGDVLFLRVKTTTLPPLEVPESEPETTESAVTPGANTGKFSWWIVVIIVVFILLLIGAGVTFGLIYTKPWKNAKSITTLTNKLTPKPAGPVTQVKPPPGPSDKSLRTDTREYQRLTSITERRAAARKNAVRMSVGAKQKSEIKGQKKSNSGEKNNQVVTGFEKISKINETESAVTTDTPMGPRSTTSAENKKQCTSSAEKRT